ncbi:MAG TPA: glycosyltransferase [Rhizomicrobium sp.]|jgi:glycosyltransferase involved in cell wall biosynthesis
MTTVVAPRPLQTTQSAPALAIVIPAFKQPGLLSEALSSILNQKASFGIGAVVVDDGCPFAETRQTAIAFARANPGRICYVRTQNAGLSAARNAGIGLALRAWPAVAALYLLDADNRMQPDFLARAFALLEESPPHIGWIYPDFDMFGIPINHSTRGPYSVLMHLLENYCEAGSLIRRSVFDAGIRFDETMRTGQEDWDFWLQAATAGFRGRHLPQSGFQYRRRVESMLSDGEGLRKTSVVQMRRKHEALTDPRTLRALAQEEMPDYALDIGDGRLRLIADPMVVDDGRAVDKATAWHEFIEAAERPAARFFPPVLCVADAAALTALTVNKLVRNVFWLARILLRDHPFVCVRIDQGEPSQLGLRVADERGFSGASLIFVSTRTASKMAVSRKKQDQDSAVKCLYATLPAAAVFAHSSSGDTLEQRFEADMAAMAQAIAGRAEGLPFDWRKDNRMQRSADTALSTLMGFRTLYPHLKRDGVRDFGVILPRCEFGGIERGKGNYAHVLRARGWRPHLFLTKPQTAYLSPLAFEAFESVNFVSIEAVEKTHPTRQYFGMWTSDLAKRAEADDVTGLLASMDAIINNHSFAAHAVAARLRRLGVRMTVGVHMTERTPVGTPLGTPHSILGYEYAYDGIIVISEMLREWCIGQGVPVEKLHLVRNAPSYPAGKGMILRSLKNKKRKDGPLNVLFLGRLDRQKGLDRLAEIIRRTRGGMIAWRMVGKSVIEDAGVELDDIDIGIEPPVHTPEELDALYEWADVMILTSRFEGVPLSILEAKRAGCVALSTDVGAVRENIEHGADGLIVAADSDEETIVRTFCEHLERLARDRRLVRAIGLRAARRGRRVRWDRNLENWAEQLEAACDAISRSRPRLASLRDA